MQWSKLKNIVLLILILTNLCLLAFVLRQEAQSRAGERQTLSSTLAFLARKGVHVQANQLPDPKSLAPLTAQRDLESEYAAAAALLRGEVQMQDRGGEVYRCVNANGSVQFHSDGSFSAELNPGVLPVGDDPEGAILLALRDMGYDAALLCSTEDTMVFQQRWKGAPLFNQQVTARYGPSGVSALSSGRRLVGQPEPDFSRSTLDTSTALIDFFNGLAELGRVCSQVDSIQAGYTGTVSLLGPMQLTPVWQVTTDTGVYQLDLVTGEVRIG